MKSRHEQKMFDHIMASRPIPITDEQRAAAIASLALPPEERRRIAALTKLAEIEEQSIRYEQYINSPEWRARADRIRARDGYRCRVCNGKHRLSVHHRTYADLGHEHDVDLLTLCSDCHQVFHDNRRLR